MIYKFNNKKALDGAWVILRMSKLRILGMNKRYHEYTDETNLQ